MHLKNRMSAYYNQTFDLILPITDKYILYIYGSYDHDVQDVSQNKLALDVKDAHRIFTNITTYSRIFTHIKVKSQEYSIYAAINTTQIDAIQNEQCFPKR